MEEAGTGYRLMLSGIPTRQKELLYAIAEEGIAEKIIFDRLAHPCFRILFQFLQQRCHAYPVVDDLVQILYLHPFLCHLMILCRSSIFTLSCVMVSRSRTVTQWSLRESWSTVTQNGVPMAS